MGEDQRKGWPVWSRTALAAAAISIAAVQPAGVMAASEAAYSTTGVSVEVTGLAQASAGQASSSTPAPVAKITKEQAVEKVRSLFPEQLKDASVTQVELGDNSSYPPRNQNVWTIHWQYTVGNGSYGFSSMVDSITGDLVQHEFHYPQLFDDTAYYPPAFSREAALEVAQEFIRRASPGVDMAALRPSDTYMNPVRLPLFGPVEYYFSFSVDHGGVRSPLDSLSVRVDGNGKVRGYSRQMLNVEYPSPTSGVPEEKAMETAQGLLEPSLQYIPVRGSDYREVKSWILAWMPRSLELSGIDAQSGESLDYNGAKLDPEAGAVTPVEKGEKRFAPVTGSENGLLTVEEAEAQARKELGLPADKRLSSQNLSPSYQNPSTKVWQLSFSEAQDKPMMYPNNTYVQIDAATGQVLEYRLSSFGPPWMEREKKEEVKNPVSKEEATRLALDWINRLYPSAAEELRLVSEPARPDSEEGAHSFRFQRYYKDIPVSSDQVNLTLDAAGGLQSYYCNRTVVQDSILDGLKTMVTAEEAFKLYTDRLELQLQYRSYGGYMKSDGSMVPQVMKLIYTHVPKDDTKMSGVLDASTGEWTALFPEQPSSPKFEVPEEIKSHWAQKELRILLEYGLMKPDDSGSFRPDGTLTLGDWMNLMTQAVNPHYQAYIGGYEDSSKPVQFADVDKESPYYNASIFYMTNKWLEPAARPELHPEQRLTREVLADNLIHIVKYDKLAAFADLRCIEELEDGEEVGDSYQGAVALAMQMGLLTASPDNRFHPQGEVTQAEAAVVLMRLVALQGKLDQGISSY